MNLLSCGISSSSTRILTVSLDRTISIYDLHTNRLYTTRSLPEALTCCTVSPSFDMAYVGGMSGVIYSIALSHSAVTLSEAHWKESQTERRNISSSVLSSSSTTSHLTLSQLIGHDKPLTSLSHSRDNITLVSAGQDGQVRIWNTVSRQCRQIVDPFSLAPISNALVDRDFFEKFHYL
jgi:WD40 repeat protein